MSLSPVYLVDASIYIFRAWFSMSDDFVNVAGEPTNAVYGFSGFLCSLLEQTTAEHVAIAFDESLSTSYRNEIYPEYKANREPAPIELKRQFAWARSVAEAMGLLLNVLRLSLGDWYGVDDAKAACLFFPSTRSPSPSTRTHTPPPPHL